MTNKQKLAVEHNQSGLAFYDSWQIDKAVAAFAAAVSADPQNPEYHLNLTRAYTRGGDYDQAMAALGGYLQTETEGDVAARYEQLFSTGLDEVESDLIEGMKQLDMPLPQIGKAIQMWLEDRIAIGADCGRIWHQRTFSQRKVPGNRRNAGPDARRLPLLHRRRKPAGQAG